MAPTHVPPRSTFAAAGLMLRRDVVFHQLDDLNAIGDTLADAMSGADPERRATILATMDRFIAAFGWNKESALSAIGAYVAARAELEDDLFAPALVLNAIAPDHAQTAALLARLAPSIRDLVALATRRSPART